MAVRAVISPFSCAECGHLDTQHRTNVRMCFGDSATRCGCRELVAPWLPEPSDLAKASVVTSWTCAHCGEHQEVEGEGEGAVGYWMECMDCGAESYLWVGTVRSGTED